MSEQPHPPAEDITGDFVKSENEDVAQRTDDEAEIRQEPEPQGVKTEQRHVSEMPPVQPHYGTDDLWEYPRLRPDGSPVNFHNYPILKFGVTVVDDEATMSVPSREHLNEVAEIYNPGGFVFETVDGTSMLPARNFLAFIAEKKFPMAQENDNNNQVYGLVDPFKDFIAGGTLGYDALEAYEKHVLDNPADFLVNLSTHDLVEHVGLVAIPHTEADKIAQLADVMARIGDPEKAYIKDIQANFVAHFDRFLDLLSYYALLPSTIKDAAVLEFKDKLWDEVEGLQSGLVSRAQSELIGVVGNTVAEAHESTPAEPLIDRQKLDENISRLQAIPQ